jgi:disulfide bond formation protein DsbB
MPLLAPRTVFLLILLAAVGALGSALAAQFSFGLKPCVLCLWQRLPYAILILAAIGGLMNRGGGLTNYLLMLCFMAALGSAGLAFFHVGVEQHWWVMGGGCPVEALTDKTEEQALAELLTTPVAACDKVGWDLFGLSITVWNTALSLVLGLYLAIVLWKQNRA